MPKRKKPSRAVAAQPLRVARGRRADPSVDGHRFAVGQLATLVAGVASGADHFRHRWAANTFPAPRSSACGSSPTAGWSRSSRGWWVPCGRGPRDFRAGPPACAVARARPGRRCRDRDSQRRAAVADAGWTGPGIRGNTPDRPVIRLDQVSKQHGPQILFVEASAAIYRGEKVGLVGPNGAGKSTIFRMIMKEESPDEGQVSVDRGVTIGYFSQDVGEMAGRPAVAEVMAGAGEVSEVAAGAEAAGRGAGRSRAGRRDGEDPGPLRRGAGALRRAGRVRAGGAGARDPGGAGVLAGDDGRGRGQAVGRLEDAGGAGAHPADAARCHVAGRAVEPPGHRIADLAGELPEGRTRGRC